MFLSDTICRVSASHEWDYGTRPTRSSQRLLRQEECGFGCELRASFEITVSTFEALCPIILGCGKNTSAKQYYRNRVLNIATQSGRYRFLGLNGINTAAPFTRKVGIDHVEYVTVFQQSSQSVCR